MPHEIRETPHGYGWEVVFDHFPTAIEVLKTPWMIDRYLELADEFGAGNIVELGVHKGGSIRLLSAAYPACRLLGLDINPPVPELDEFLQHHGFDERVEVLWQTDQADVETLDHRLRRVFGDTPLDLVIDDASHLLGPSRASFATLFPRLRPGGLFVLEDWSHDHEKDRALAEAIATDTDLRDRLAERIQEQSSGQAGPGLSALWTQPLSTLLIELILLAAARPEIVESIALRQGWAEIRRGPADLTAPLETRPLLGTIGQHLVAQIDNGFA